MKILRNAAQCRGCNELIVSTHRHDFRTCKCGNISVDGGEEYIRRVGKLDGYIEACAYDASTATRPSDLTGKFLVFGPSGSSNPAVAFDRQQDAEASAQMMATRTGQKLWYTALLFPVVEVPIQPTRQS